LELSAALCLFVRTLPIDFALLGRKRKWIKSKTTAKLNGKQTSIATVWDLYQMYATFLTPLGSHYRLPLRRVSFYGPCHKCNLFLNISPSGGKRYTLHVYTVGSGKGYILYIQTAGGGKGTRTRGSTTWTGDFKCREVKTGFWRKISMQTGSSGTHIGWKSVQTTDVPLWPIWDRMEGVWLQTQEKIWKLLVFFTRTNKRNTSNNLPRNA
jgi:hypothetical protein